MPTRGFPVSSLLATPLSFRVHEVFCRGISPKGSPVKPSQFDRNGIKVIKFSFIDNKILISSSKQFLLLKCVSLLNFRFAMSPLTVNIYADTVTELEIN